jgi:sensor histidine kinase YesM
MPLFDQPVSSVERMVRSMEEDEACIEQARLHRENQVSFDSMLLSFLSRNRMVLLHLSFWVLYASYRFYDIVSYVGANRAAMYVGIPLAFNLMASYGHYFFLLPIWIVQKKLLRYFLWFVVLISVILTARILFENYAYQHIPNAAEYYSGLKFSRFVSVLWDTLTFIIFTGMIRFTMDRFDLETKRKQLENEKLVAELNYLKAQINPHFLFNTLHNLNYLVYSGSKNATEVIIKLSNIMRYMIYDASKERVPLSREIDYMQDYIHLESIRLNNAFQMDFRTLGPVAHVEIAPLVLITLLENAFKHGVSDREKDCWINADLRVTDASVFFQVSNRKLLNDHQHLPSGFGLNNLRQRLALSYPGKHTLDIQEDRDIYKITLTLNRE